MESWFIRPTACISWFGAPTTFDANVKLFRVRSTAFAGCGLILVTKTPVPHGSSFSHPGHVLWNALATGKSGALVVPAT